MENRIDGRFAQLRANGQVGFVAYITGGDPNLARTEEVAAGLAEAGIDFLEIGVPFSDPLADGIANQLGAQRALQSGTTLPKLLYTVANIRAAMALPIVLYSYLNPILQYGLDRFEEDAATVGVDGLLLLDLPPDEPMYECSSQHLHRIRLVAPTTSPDRIGKIAADASGFIYYVCREGVTGEQTELAASIPEQVARIREHTKLPIAVGFGISTAEQAATVAQSADAVVVGSAIVRRIGEYGRDADLGLKIRQFVQPLAAAVHETSKLAKA